MARPIPDINLKDLSKIAGNKPEHGAVAVAKVIGKRATKDLILGTFSGWLAGLTLTKVGKIAACGLGGSVILLHIASENGYINVNWDKIREAAQRTQTVMDEILQFTKNNNCFSMGFVGGFFFGMASS